jgi:hypothetical protein
MVRFTIDKVVCSDSGNSSDRIVLELTNVAYFLLFINQMFTMIGSLIYPFFLQHHRFLSFRLISVSLPSLFRHLCCRFTF